MLNIIWPGFIIGSFVIAILTGRINELNTSIFTSAQSAVETTIVLLGTMCLWSGIIKIIQNTSINNKINKRLEPIMYFLFPKLKREEEVYSEITMNISANMLGIGNAATPLGIKAMESLYKKNKQKKDLSEEMMMFIILNTSSIQIIPTTIIAIRASLGAEKPADIIVPIWIATITANIFGVLLVKTYIKTRKRRKVEDN